MKKRILLLLSVVALVLAMLAVSIVPAFGAPTNPCPGNNGSIVSDSQAPEVDRNNNGFICRFDRFDKDFNLVSTRYKDDRIL
jgi:hypothetical protein